MAGAAYAAACPSGTGVTVVVNSSVRCDSNGGGSAASNFRDAGHSLTMASRQPGFVCRVDGSPASDPCVNASPSNAYWALFWANGKGGGWTYSSSGVGGLSVPTGGWVGFKFRSGGKPGVTPYTPPPAPEAQTKADDRAQAEGLGEAKCVCVCQRKRVSEGVGQGVGQAQAQRIRVCVRQRIAAEADDETVNTSSSTDSGGSNAMVWVAGAFAALLIAGMGVAAWRRSAAGRQS